MGLREDIGRGEVEEESGEKAEVRAEGGVRDGEEGGDGGAGYGGEGVQGEEGEGAVAGVAVEGGDGCTC
jgi:hypothetical protein